MSDNTAEMEFEIVPEGLELEVNAKQSLEESFSGFFDKAREWGEQSSLITDPKLARAARLEVRKLRIDAEKVRKELKAESLRVGKAIDGVNNVFLALVVPIENRLNDIEKAEERRIAEELRLKVEQRNEEYRQFHNEELPFPEFGSMTDEQFAAVLQDAKTTFEIRRKAAAEAEAKRLEEERLEAERLEAQRLENIKLKAEAEAREAEIAKEREQAEEARKKLEEEQAKERAAIAAKAKAEADAREKAEAETRKLKKAEEEREAKLKEERDRAARAEEERIKREEEEAKKAASAPDREKLLKFAELIKELSVPDVSTVEAKLVADEISEKMIKFSDWIEKKSESL